MDQAEQLRRQIFKTENKTSKAIAVLSGKGGVGKSGFTVNLAAQLCGRGKRALILDLDIGYGNIDLLIGESSRHSMIDFFQGEKKLSEIICKSSAGFDYISGGTGLSHVVSLNDMQLSAFSQELDQAFCTYDYLLLDLGAGMTSDSLKFAMSADELAVVTTPEPTAITDAYSAIKVISFHEKSIPVSIVVNKADDEKTAQLTFARMQSAVTRFLDREVSFAGWMPQDALVSEAVKRQVPFSILFPKCPASRGICRIADSMVSAPGSEAPPQKTSFFSRVSQLFRGGGD
ncbi:MinD/ParA family protein [Metabacillus sp. JX24]|uniref:MinD/ParA family protein n=1 Tax=Metabacillus sp. JX24 TaxID=3240759 RepID=UPI0035102C7F